MQYAELAGHKRAVLVAGPGRACRFLARPARLGRPALLSNLPAEQAHEAIHRVYTLDFDEARKPIAGTAAQLLRKEFGAQKVVVFGSLVHEKGFGLWSDIDLGAWGIPPEKFYSAVAAATGLSPFFKIDLVDVAECRPTLQKVIEKEGIEV